MILGAWVQSLLPTKNLSMLQPVMVWDSVFVKWFFPCGVDQLGVSFISFDFGGGYSVCGESVIDYFDPSGIDFLICMLPVLHVYNLFTSEDPYQMAHFRYQDLQ